MNKLIFICVSSIIFLAACSNTKKIIVPGRNSSSITGNEFYKKAVAYYWHQRDSFAVKEILSGNIPSFLKRFVAVNTEIRDSSGKRTRAIYYVSPDYLSIGSNNDWARIPLSPMAAQQIANSR